MRLYAFLSVYALCRSRSVARHSPCERPQREAQASSECLIGLQNSGRLPFRKPVRSAPPTTVADTIFTLMHPMLWRLESS